MGLNEVFKKVADIKSESVELASHEVELASATDLPKLYANALSMANVLLGEMGGKVATLKAILKQKETEGLKMISDLDGAMIDFAKKAKELGIDPKTAPLYGDSRKELDALYKGVKYVQGIIGKI
jgi:hypothetical protein